MTTNHALNTSFIPARTSSIILTSKEKNMLADAQQEGLKRGIILLSTLTYDWEALAFQAVGSTVNIASSNVFSSNSPASTSAKERVSTGGDEIAFDAIQGLLSKVWSKIEDKINKDHNIQRLVKTLKIGLSVVIAWIKNIVLSKALIGNLVPGYAAVKGLIDGAMGTIETHGHRTAWESLKDASPSIAGGFPRVALSAFEKYVQVETVRSGLKTAYTFAKTLTSVLLQVFTMGASSIFDFVTSIVEAVSSFAYNTFQAITFGKATDLCRECVKERKLMKLSDFQIICASSTFVGCVFFGAANYIGHFNLTSVLSNDNSTISSSSLLASVAKVGEVQKLASKYVDGANFEMKFRTKEEEAEYGWTIKMMKGYASDAPKSEFLTSNASNFTKFKHGVKKLFYRITS